MKVNYLGPLAECANHPAIQEMPISDLPASSFLVEVAPDAGVDGELMEGDVLVADENRITEYGDVVLACDEYDEMRAYHSHRVGGCLRLVPMGGGEAVPASALDCVGVVVRRARDPANEIQQGTPPMAITLAEVFEPWFSLSTWSTPNPADARRFHECCARYLDRGGSMSAYTFAETLRVAISLRHRGRWDDYSEQALQRRAKCAEAISEFMHDAFQTPR
ncbi:hypothetical protein AAGT95_03010 [Salinicola lusitanus]|uniref:Peptidase S24/S26A/S26B/S26C domain-containing protein n=1 Tax=Salinicola lusitanus TaxID=1949085 RepID=A0ABZ3CUX4_9GAMM